MKTRYYLLLLPFLLPSCKGFLDEKPSKSLVVPETLPDLMYLLDNSQQVMDRGPGLTVIGADELVITDNGWASVSDPVERNAYLWQKDIFEGASAEDWDIPFRQVFYCNIVLDQLEKFGPGEYGSREWKRIKGIAHFKRAYAYYELSQLFMPTFDPAGDSPLGLPLRTSPNVTDSPPRATVWETYAFMVGDLEESIPHLLDMEDIKVRPDKSAAMALLARIRLLQQRYGEAASLASQVLSGPVELLDYNTLNPALPFPFPMLGNTEVLYFSRMNVFLSFLLQSNTLNNAYLDLYAAEDLRKKLFFVQRPNGNTNFKGSYTGQSTPFTGISLNEVFLIAAESNAWIGNLGLAASFLDRLLEKRFPAGEHRPIEFVDRSDLLRKIHEERRRELIMRGLRWSDIRRLNGIPGFEYHMQKTIGGETYMLGPSSLNYTLPFPDIEISNNGFAQNPRQ